MVVGARAQELRAEAHVLVGQAHHLPGHLLLGTLGGQVQLTRQAQRLRNARQQRLGIRDADGVQEGTILDRGRGQVAHGGLGKKR